MELVAQNTRPRYNGKTTLTKTSDDVMTRQFTVVEFSQNGLKCGFSIEINLSRYRFSTCYVSNVRICSNDSQRCVQ